MLPTSNTFVTQVLHVILGIKCPKWYTIYRQVTKYTVAWQCFFHMYTKRAGQLVFRNNIQVVAYFKLELCRTDSNSTHQTSISPLPPSKFRAYVPLRIEETHKKKKSEACNFQMFFTVFVNNKNGQCNFSLKLTHLFTLNAIPFIYIFR